MSVSFYSDMPTRTWTAAEPCLCTQEAESFGQAVLDGVDVEAVRADLHAHAFSDCPTCAGTGVEAVRRDGAPTLNWSNQNASVMLAVLGVSPQLTGLPLADARRAVMRGRARRDVARFVRDDSVLHSGPHVLGDGVVELRPVRGWSRGLDEADIRERVEAFAEFVEEVGRRGGTRIWWE